MSRATASKGGGGAACRGPRASKGGLPLTASTVPGAALLTWSATAAVLGLLAFALLLKLRRWSLPPSPADRVGGSSATAAS